MDLPPPMIEVEQQLNSASSAYVVPYAPECSYLTHSQAQYALRQLQQNLPGTTFVAAGPSEICGLVKVEMESGTVVYTEPTGRYLMLTFAFDTNKGSPADVGMELQAQIEKRQSSTNSPIPNASIGIEADSYNLPFLSQ